MYKILKRTCLAIVLPIRSFVFPCPRCRHRRGLLKVPSQNLRNRYEASSVANQIAAFVIELSV